jgi:thiosulfate reductase cytochrome b subunit
MLGVALGWVLLLDTLAFWSRSVYALGFGEGALWCVALGLLVFAWLWNGVAMWALCAVLLVFAVSRLPSGNLWDALLDPLLWFGLHLKLLREVWAAYKAKKSHNATANTDPAL